MLRLLQTKLFLNLRQSPRSSVFLLALFAMGWTTLSFFPGNTNFDSRRQYEQVKSGIFSDWHPPIMAAIWRIFDPVLPGPKSLFLLHNLLFWLGVSILALLIPGLKRKVGIFLFFILCPPITAFLGTVIKDVAMGCSLFLASCLLFVAQVQGRRLLALISLPFLWYGIAMRHNGILAAIPLAIWFSAILVKDSIGYPFQASRTLKTKIAVTFLGLSVSLACYCSIKLLNKTLTQGRSDYPAQQILLHDLVAISIQDGVNYLPDTIKLFHFYTIDDLKLLYDPGSIVELYHSHGLVPKLPKFHQQEEFALLRIQWARTVCSHPLLYLWHRLLALQTMMNLNLKPCTVPYTLVKFYSPLDLNITHFSLKSLILVYLHFFRNSYFFRGWFHLALAPFLVLFARRSHPEYSSIAFALGASGALYGWAYFFVGTYDHFRLMWWPAVCNCLLLSLILFFPSSNRPITFR